MSPGVTLLSCLGSVSCAETTRKTIASANYGISMSIQETSQDMLREILL